jgi:hypothetical protein
MHATPIHGPQVNNVTQQEDVFGRVGFEELQQVLGLAGLGAQVDIGQKDRPDLLHSHAVAAVARAWLLGSGQYAF